MPSSRVFSRLASTGRRVHHFARARSLRGLASAALLILSSACESEVGTSRSPYSAEQVTPTAIQAHRAALFAGHSCSIRAWGGHEYRFCDGSHTWNQAANHCAGLGLRLAKVDSAEEEAFIRGRLEPLSISWVGGSRPLFGNTWSWNFDGSPFYQSSLFGGSALNGAYTNWAFAEPSLGNCTMLKGGIFQGWYAAHCDVHAGYVCENPDACPNDPNKMQPGVCGCGQPDVDHDGNGVADCMWLANPAEEPDVEECVLKAGSRPQGDMTSSALLFMDSVISFADYLALAQDRRDKTDAIFDRAGYACDILRGDVDGDLVPDSIDACPQTPPLTPTDDQGCTDSTRPDAPDSDKVREVVNDMVLIWQHNDDHSCDATVVQSPTVVAGYINNTQLGSAFVAAFFRFTVPGACPARLRVEVSTNNPAGWPVDPGMRVMYFEVPASDFGPAYSAGAEVPGVASLILRDETFGDAYQNLWNAMADDSGLDSSGQPAFSMTIRAMAVYGDGRQSSWSPSVAVRPWGNR